MIKQNHRLIGQKHHSIKHSTPATSAEECCQGCAKSGWAAVRWATTAKRRERQWQPVLYTHRCLPLLLAVHPLKQEQRGCLYRHNEELEQDSVAMQAEARKLQREANSLARRLEAVMHDKLKARTSFDAATPIDKTLQYLQNAIMVSSQPLPVFCVCLTRQPAMHTEQQTRPFQENQQPSSDALLRA